jgi:hypothetical protein
MDQKPKKPLDRVREKIRQKNIPTKAYRLTSATGLADCKIAQVDLALLESGLRRIRGL